MKLFLILMGLFYSSFCYGETICFAHRGGGWDFFDNSLSAFKGAIGQNFEGVETDLHQTKDGQIILLHDDNLEKVATGSLCKMDVPVDKLTLQEIKSNCRLTNGEEVPTLKAVFGLIRDSNLLVILDLKDLLNHESIKFILDAGISAERFRLTAFYPEFLKLVGSSHVLTGKQIESWNSIPRYENFRHPVFSQTEFRKNFHLFSAFTYAHFVQDEKFGAWEVNYPIFLSWILPLKPEFIVTKNPRECMRIRDGR